MSLITYIYDVVINRIHIPHNEVYKVVSDAFNESSIMKDQVKKKIGCCYTWSGITRLTSKSLIGWVPT